MVEMISFSKSERAQRLQRLRAAVKIPVHLFKKYGIAYNSFRNWEQGVYSGLNETGAVKLTQICTELGYEVTVEWLLFGIGPDPFDKFTPINDRDNAAKELLFYHLHVNDSVDHIITDDGLAPCLQPNDLVAGKCLYDQAMEYAIGFPAIVKTHADEILVRVIHSGSDIELYNLECTNPHTTVSQSIMTDIKLCYAAPILWMRRTI